MRASRVDEPPACVTAAYSVRLLRPTPTDGPVRLSARVVEAGADRATVDATVEAAGQITATCRGTFVAVPPGHPAYGRW
jgi:acyl-coenzyme A thioesterase PaaI-like protein